MVKAVVRGLLAFMTWGTAVCASLMGAIFIYQGIAQISGWPTGQLVLPAFSPEGLVSLGVVFILYGVVYTEAVYAPLRSRKAAAAE